MNKINEYRTRLDIIDDNIANLLIERLSLVEKIGIEKKKTNLPVLDSAREESIKNRLSKISKTSLEKNYLLKIYDNIMKISKEVQIKD